MREANALRQEVSGFRPVNDCVGEVLDCRTYGLAKNLSHYDDKVAKSIASWAKLQQIQMRLQISDSLCPISVISFLSTFFLACDTKNVHNVAALWWWHYFTKRPATDSLTDRTALWSKSQKLQVQDYYQSLLWGSFLLVSGVRHGWKYCKAVSVLESRALFGVLAEGSEHGQNRKSSSLVVARQRRRKCY